MSTSSTPASGSSTPVNRHALTAVEKQRSQLERLLKDPSKPAYVPPPPKEKSIRPPREMMKNVQGSSAGAGSGEFHVYKASRRREYERLKLMEEEAEKEMLTAEFEKKRREAEEAAEAKTAKNRAKRQKKKQKAKQKSTGPDHDKSDAHDTSANDAPIKKRRLVNGEELVFRKPGDASDDEDEEETHDPEAQRSPTPTPEVPPQRRAPVVDEGHKLTILEDD